MSRTIRVTTDSWGFPGKKYSKKRSNRKIRRTNSEILPEGNYCHKIGSNPYLYNGLPHDFTPVKEGTNIPAEKTPRFIPAKRLEI